jgi:two-component system NtrC family sensor kinase
MLIRKKILFTTVLLTGTLLLWMYCSLRGVYAYRSVSLVIRQLAIELRISNELRNELDDLLRLAVAPDTSDDAWLPKFREARPSTQFREQLRNVERKLDDYEAQVKSHMQSDPLLADRSQELGRVAAIHLQLDAIRWISDDLQPDFVLASTKLLKSDLEQLAVTVQELPTFLYARMESFRDNVRNRYRTLIALISISSIAALVIVGSSFWFFRHSVVQPFKVLLSGSRAIAHGQFEHRIHLQSDDELSELANALNKMTDRFVAIRDNLNATVQQRTREVVRSEQLASVGFLAAGVAHEINNPLASIAWSAEALESRLHEILHKPQQTNEESLPHSYDEDQIEVLRKYLKRIQDEAFRCKGITERLLDFSRLGESQRKQETDIYQSITDVIALVKHLGQYRNKSIEFHGEKEVVALVSPTEFKQVVLNLLTNALDACQDGGLVSVELTADHESLTLSVKDNGCGMTEEVLQHLFEPFFTRRRDGRGTGLGLSITYRIVQDHDGSLVPFSSGPDQGSTLVLKLPLKSADKRSYEGFKFAA